MTLRTFFLLAAAFQLSVSCSIKELRGECPCRLTVDLSDASEDYADVLVSAYDGTAAVHCCETISSSHEKLFINLPKSRIRLLCMQGASAGRTDGRNVFIPEGSEADSLMISADSVDCTGETAFSKAVFHKNWARVSVSYINPDSTPYPYRIAISGKINGMNLDTMTPSEGIFRCNARHSPEKQMFVADLPRQRPDGEGLVMKLVRNDDQSTAKEYNLSGIISSSGYDWKAIDLNDIRLGIDYAGAIAYISVTDWETGMEISMTI